MVNEVDSQKKLDELLSFFLSQHFPIQAAFAYQALAASYDRFNLRFTKQGFKFGDEINENVVNLIEVLIENMQRELDPETDLYATVSCFRGVMKEVISNLRAGCIPEAEHILNTRLTSTEYPYIEVLRLMLIRASQIGASDLPYIQVSRES